jgi:hypothetical protein
MKPYRKYDWPALFLAFEQSDLNQTQFCLEQSLNPKYFSQKRKAALREPNTSFTKVMVQPQSDLPTTLDPPGQAWRIQVGRCHIHSPDNASLTSIAALVEQLA